MSQKHSYLSVLLTYHINTFSILLSLSLSKLQEIIFVSKIYGTSKYKSDEAEGEFLGITKYFA